MTTSDARTLEPNGRPHAASPAELEAAATLARRIWGVAAVSARRLPGERDRNFMVECEGGDRYVLRLAPAGTSRAPLEAQDHALRRLGGEREGFRFPEPVPATDGRTVVDLAPGDARLGGGAPPENGAAEHPPSDRGVPARLLTWVPGRPLVRVRPHRPDLLADIGRLLATADRALEGLEPPPQTDGEFEWDLRAGRRMAEARLEDVRSDERRALVRRGLALFDEVAGPLSGELREWTIHGDGNDWNVLVAQPHETAGPRVAPDAASDPAPSPRAAGLIDFGDFGRSWLVAEPAIGAAYAMLGKHDPLAAGAALLSGYHRTLALTEPEIEAFHALVVLRLCVSVTTSSRRRRLEPDNQYLTVSEAPAWALLERLDGVHPHFAHYCYRAACGLPACPATAAVVGWLRDEAEPGPVLDPDPARVRRTTIDLTPGSLETARVPGDADASAWSRAIRARMEETGALVGLGRWGEPRRWYTEPAYRVETDGAPEWRTVHLGVDLFAPPGTPVRAPLAGRVAAVRDNAGPLQYGPTVVLRHDDAGRTVHTLYAHLDRICLDRLTVGQGVRKGQRIGAVGAPPAEGGSNGGWAPHLHLQLIVDPLDRKENFPGVARPSELDVWTALSPDPNLLLRLPELETDGDPRSPAVEKLVRRRRQRLGRNLSISYHRPLHIVRGWMQHLQDPLGQCYLDCVNNVAHVGHSHPRVAEALERQARVLNTNTRYLHEGLLGYAERLAATFPRPLGVCFFTCSGSEANELALRLARAHTGRRDVVVLEGAYHGNTGGLVDLSPYKLEGPGGHPPPATTRIAPLPDPYRGRHRGTEAADGYLRDLDEVLRAGADAGRPPAALLAEPLPGCAGQVVPPEGWLAGAFERIRAAGGVAIADEVQTGFGRVGPRFWAFAAQDAVPDIVTLGKPMGNGHPVGGVVTTPRIAASFAGGMEYFNTFGGNPVSCAVGLAVLDVLRDEGLPEHAAEVGAGLRTGLDELAARHEVVGDVRGMGLFLGVELVADRGSRRPAGRAAAYVVERMRELGVLLSADGVDRNVLKIKPPLPFSRADADRIVEALDRVLGEDGAGPDR